MAVRPSAVGVGSEFREKRMQKRKNINKHKKLSGVEYAALKKDRGWPQVVKLWAALGIIGMR